MNPEVGLLLTLGLLLLSHVCLVLVVDEINDWRPRVTVVDIIAESWGVNDAELDLELLLFKLCLDYLDLCQFVELLVVAPRVIFGRGQLGGEERVDQGGLAQARFTYKGSTRARLDNTMKRTDYHHGEMSTVLGDDFVPLLNSRDLNIYCNDYGTEHEPG